jgi:hypothetical protein
MVAAHKGFHTWQQSC